MSFRKHLKATFKELFKGGGVGAAGSKRVGAEYARDRSDVELVASPTNVVISPTLSGGDSSTRVAPGRSQEKVPSYNESIAPGYNSSDVQKASEAPAVFPVREKSRKYVPF